MPYAANSELPKAVRNNLSQHAQDIYRESFNHALNQYESDNKRRGNDSREKVAYKVTWSAVRKIS
jgi:cation transport regulator